MPHTLDDLLAAVGEEDRLLLVTLSSEYLRAVLARNSIVLSQWTHPGSWSEEWRGGIDMPSPEMVALQTKMVAEFARIFERQSEDVRMQVYAILLGWFSV